MKYFLLFILSFLICFLAEAQKLSFGIKSVFPVSANLESPGRLDYYYADDINSHYTVLPEKKLQLRSLLTLKPYLQFMFNDDWFAIYELSYLDYQKTYGIKYNTTYVEMVNLDTRFNYGFLTNCISIGYKFLRTKEIRPSLYIGANLMTLMRFKEITDKADEYRLVNNNPYGQVIYQDISSLKDNFITYTAGFGLEYYVLKIDFWYDLSPSETGKTSDFYGNYSSLNFSVGFNLFNILLKSKKVIKYNEAETNY
jgi:hypothetical protein